MDGLICAWCETAEATTEAAAMPSCAECAELVAGPQPEPEPENPLAWKRADHGHLPEVGRTVSRVTFRADDLSISVQWALVVQVVLDHPRVGIYGAGLEPTPGIIGELPERPTDINGKQAILWRYCDVQS